MGTQQKIVQPPALAHDAMMLKRFGTEVNANGKLERRIVANLIARIEAAGFKVVSGWDGEEQEECNDAKSAMEFIFNLDQAHLYVKKKGFKQHWIFLVLGNGIDIVSDWTYTEGDADGFSAAMDKFDPEAFA